MRQYDDNLGTYLAKVSAYVLAWLASWSLGDVQQLAGIFSALAIGVVALMNGYLAIRNQLRRESTTRPWRDTKPSAPGDLK